MNTHALLYERIKAHCEIEDESIVEAGQYGADAGWCGFTYTHDCVEFYDNNESLIYDLLYEQAEMMGHKNIDEMVSQFNRSDMLSTADGRKNLLAWFALEEVGRWLTEGS
jgi:hypothetical protein